MKSKGFCLLVGQKKLKDTSLGSGEKKIIIIIFTAF